MDRPDFHLRLLGRLRLQAKDGHDLTPRSAKMQAVLAMLALAPEFKRSRVWMQNRLWSDRGPAQAAASLRQDLSEFRKFLGASVELIQADRQMIWLDEKLFASDIGPGDRRIPKGQILLEGLRVRDPAFRKWLDGMRQQGSGPELNAFPEGSLVAPALQTVRIEAESHAGIDGFMTSQFLDLVAQILAERTSLIILPKEVTHSDNVAMRLVAAGYAFGDANGLTVRLEAPDLHQTLWSRSKNLPKNLSAENDKAFHTLANQAADQLVNSAVERWRRGDAGIDATVLCQTAIGKLFTFKPEEQDASDRLFDMAFKSDPRGLYLAWRVMLRVIRVVEMYNLDASQTLEEVAELSEHALRLEPENSMVLAASANAAMLIHDDMIAGRELADRSVAANSANPFAWDCQSIWHLLAGEFERAHQLQLHARAIAADVRYKHWWDMGCALTSTVTGRFDDARYFAECASALVPDFRPPLRYLTVLYARENRLEDSHKIKMRLEQIEPGFSVERMVEDPTYPSAALKRSSLANRDLVRRLS